MPHPIPPLPDDVYVVILAGGSGTRFWPRSRHLKPKQLCKIGGQPQTMIELTLARLDGFVPPERRLIVTHQEQAPHTRALVQGKCAHVIPEPEARNTANALALAALEIDALARPKGQRPVMISLHADHLIADVDAFRAALAEAVAVAREGRLTLLGIVPEAPETGFGYIERGAALAGHQGAFQVQSFREKPERRLAEEYVASGRFYWNAGLFVWRVDVLMEELRKTLVQTVDKLTAAKRGTMDLAAAYRELPKISIDHAVLEVSRNVAVVPAEIGWRDVGSWDALAKCFPATDELGNLLFGDGCLIDTRGTTVDSDGPFVAALGLDDMVVVVSGGAVLVCPKERAQDVKEVVTWLQAKGRRDLL